MALKITIIILLGIFLFFCLAQQIYGTNPKHSADDDESSSEFFGLIDLFEENDENEGLIKQNVASSSSSVKKSHEESIKKKNKTIVTKNFSPKFLKVFKRKGKAIIDEHEKQKDKNQKNKGIVEQNDVEETLNSPRKQREFLNETEKSGQNDYSENEKAIVPAEYIVCNFCFENVKFDQLCFCDRLMAERIFGGGSSSNQQQTGSHAFCIECLKYYTNETDERWVAFAKGGIGLKCMAENCENPIPWHEISQRMPDRIKLIRALEKQCDDLCVAMSASLCLGREHSVPQELFENSVESDKVYVSDDGMKCSFCFDDIKFDQFCVCDHLMEDKVFGCGSSNDTEKESHAFCRECLQNYTEAAPEMKTFARCWLGLKCMAENCENPIPWQELKAVLPGKLETIQALENICTELCVSAAKEFGVEEPEHFDESEKRNVPDDSVECPICCENANYDQLCFCDQMMAEKIFGSNSNNQQKESHAFCIECLRKYTEAAHEEMPFSRGGLGLKCMALNCENPLSWQEIKDRLPDQLNSIQTLENHCAELCVSMAGLCLVRCPNCDCAIGIETSDTDNGTNSASLKFQCPECQFEMCRKCKMKWDERHKDLTCEQYDKLKNYKDDPIDKRLSEAIIHQCVKCNIQFIKDDGCNHMKCPKCKTHQCYCCRKTTGEAYESHFCKCVGLITTNASDPTKCTKCGKCLIHSDVNKFEEENAAHIQREAQTQI